MSLSQKSTTLQTIRSLLKQRNGDEGSGAQEIGNTKPTKQHLPVIRVEKQQGLPLISQHWYADLVIIIALAWLIVRANLVFDVPE